jgi:hypothetical protein
VYFIPEEKLVLFDLLSLKRTHIKKIGTTAISENDILGVLYSAGN